jgi:hypothetical protein
VSVSARGVWPTTTSDVALFPMQNPSAVQRLLPRSAAALLEAADCVSAIHALQSEAGAAPEAARSPISHLGTCLDQVGAELSSQHGADVGQPLSDYAERLQCWSPGAQLPTLAPQLSAELPWVMCGPLKSWGRSARVTLLVARPRTRQTRRVNAISSNTTQLSERLTRGVGSGNWELAAGAPNFAIADVLLASGESASHHKHFAHFMPADAFADDPDNERDAYTIVFGNLVDARARVILAPLCRQLADFDLPTSGSDALLPWFAWFRGHDLGHFWTTSDQRPKVIGAHTGSDFDAAILEEAAADLLGLVAAVEWCGADACAFYVAEMIRVARRDPDRFVDSAAAVLELRLLSDAKLIRWTSTGRIRFDCADIADGAMPVLAEVWRARFSQADGDRLMSRLLESRALLVSQVRAAAVVDDLVYT